MGAGISRMSALSCIDDWVCEARLAQYSARSLAKRRLVSASQLRRFFLQLFRRPPQEWLDELRLWHAMELLVQGRSTKEVASLLSFADTAHLCHRFKEYHGCTPSDFLKIHTRRIREAKAKLGFFPEESFPWKAAERALERQRCD
jgi:AraC-like DNA-binding protein